MSDEKKSLPPAVIAGSVVLVAVLALTGVKVYQGSQQAAAPSSAAVVGKIDPTDHKVSSHDAVMAVPLNSERGVNYKPLQEAIANNEWQKADRFTYTLLNQAAGPQSVKAGSVTQAEMDTLPGADLKTVDNLWTFGSHGRYGFTAQERLLMKHANDWVSFYVDAGWLEKDGRTPAVSFKYDVAKGQMVYKQEPDWDNLRVGELPTFERNYNHNVSLDKRLAEVGIK